MRYKAYQIIIVGVLSLYRSHTAYVYNSPIVRHSYIRHFIRRGYNAYAYCSSTSFVVPLLPPINLGMLLYHIYIRHIQRFYCSFIVPFFVPKTTPQLAGRIEAMIDRATSQSSRSLQPRREFQDRRSQAQMILERRGG